MDTSTQAVYAVVSGFVVAAAMGLLGACAVRHARNALGHARPLQMLFLRLEIIFALFLALFYLHVLYATNLSAIQPLVHFCFPLLEGLALFCFFNMMVLLVGGTAAAVARMDPTKEKKASWLTSPYKKSLDAYRQLLVLFLSTKPILGAVDGWAVSHLTDSTNTSKATHRTVHYILVVVLNLLTVATFAGVLRTFFLLKRHIAQSFNLTLKFAVVKSMFYIST
ncbi:hypothetical protein As57867_004996, partial [Aphanomyces stellatus]